MLVKEYFAKPLTDIGNGTIRKLGYDFLFALHNNFGRFDKIHERGRQTPSPRHRTTAYTLRLCIASRGKNDFD